MTNPPTDQSSSLTPDVLQAVGSVIVDFTYLERILELAIEVLNAPMPGALINRAAHRTLMKKFQFRQKLDAMRAMFADSHVPDGKLKHYMDEACKRIEELSLRRNAAVHGGWVIQEGDLRQVGESVSKRGYRIRYEPSGVSELNQLAADTRLAAEDVFSLIAEAGLIPKAP